MATSDILACPIAMLAVVLTTATGARIEHLALKDSLGLCTALEPCPEYHGAGLLGNEDLMAAEHM